MSKILPDHVAPYRKRLSIDSLVGISAALASVLQEVERLDDELGNIVLEPRLQAVIEAPLVRGAGGWVLEPLAAHAPGPEAFPDRTGYEAFVNKIHIDDFLDADGAEL